MNGDTVARRVMRYAHDMEEIRLNARLAEDIALRITPRIDGAAGRSGGHSDAPYSVAARKDELERAGDARSRCYDLELLEAARLIACLPGAACGDVMRRTVFSGETARQIAASTHQSEDSVRSLRRRGWAALAAASTTLGDGDGYAQDRRLYEEAMRRAGGRGAG